MFLMIPKIKSSVCYTLLQANENAESPYPALVLRRSRSLHLSSKFTGPFNSLEDTSLGKKQAPWLTASLRTRAIRRSIWNREYAAGRWTCLDFMPNDCVLPYLNAHSKGGRILDIGCGPGAIGEAIDPLAYRHYLGVDISDVAIEKARARNSRLNNVYTVGAMWTFSPTDTYDLIFFGDSLYNFGFSGGKKILNRYSSYLNEDGVFVIRTWVSLGRARAIIELIESDYDVIQKRSFAFQSPLIIIVFKPKIPIRSQALL